MPLNPKFRSNLKQVDVLLTDTDGGVDPGITVDFLSARINLGNPEILGGFL